MPDYNKNAESALASIQKAGRSLAIARTVNVTNKETGEVVSSTTESGTLAAVVLPRYKGVLFDSLDDNLKSDMVRGRLRSVLAAAKGAPFKPRALDVITIDGEAWEVVGMTELSPAGIPIIYTLGIRQK